MKILLKHSLLSPEIKHQIAHNHKNQINLTGSDSKSSSSDNYDQAGGTGSSSRTRKEKPYNIMQTPGNQAGNNSSRSVVQDSSRIMLNKKKRRNYGKSFIMSDPKTIVKML